MNTGISLITMSAGNVKVLRKTFESFSGLCDEIVYADMLLFEEDREILHSYKNDFNLRIVELPFNYIFNNGFASVLNVMADVATNNLSLYMNTSEVISKDNGAKKIIEDNPDCNTFYFDHATDGHRWYRLADRRDLKWSGMIHEQLSPEDNFKPYHRPIFQMADLEKDMDSDFKAKVLNSSKECVYFQNYLSIIDNPETLGATDPGWIKFAKDNYDSFKERLQKKGAGYQAYIDGDLESYLRHVHDSPEFKNETFSSSIALEYQGDKKYLL